jgi:hypothetical protein
MSSFWLYAISVALLIVTAGTSLVVGIRYGAFRALTTLDLATAAVLICLLHVAVIPWHVGLARIPGLDALVFSIPYTTVLLIGVCLVPKMGFATLLVFGQGLLGQLLGRGINPAWWPYYLWCAWGVETLLTIAGRQRKRLPFLMAIGLFRGGLAYVYMYLILAPFLWQQFYAPWYVFAKTAMGLVGCAIGAVIAWRLIPRIEKAVRSSGL